MLRMNNQLSNEMININAYERGKAAGSKNKPRQAMNDAHFVSAMTEAVELNTDVLPRTLKDHYISEWKRGWDAAKASGNTVVDIDPPKKKKVSKKKAKK